MQTLFKLFLLGLALEPSLVLFLPDLAEPFRTAVTYVSHAVDIGWSYSISCLHGWLSHE